MIKLLIKIIIIFIIIIFLFILNKETTRSIYINYDLIEYKLPVYQRVYSFLNRHFNFRYLVKKINLEHDNKHNIILNTSKWVNQNIKRVTEGLDIIDGDPLLIVERRLGDQYQFNDLLSVLLIYQDIESIFYNDNLHALTLFKIDNYWSVIDPYYGFYFSSEDNFFASIEELQSQKWEILNLDSRKVESLDLINNFDGKITNYYSLKSYYQKIFDTLEQSQIIDQINIFERSGRSYVQKPINRLHYEIYMYLNNLK